MIYYRPRKEKQHYMIFVNYHYILGKSRERIPKKSSCNAEKTACGTMSAEASTSEKQSGFSATLLSQRKSPEKEKKKEKIDKWIVSKDFKGRFLVRFLSHCLSLFILDIALGIPAWDVSWPSSPSTIFCFMADGGAYPGLRYPTPKANIVLHPQSVLVGDFNPSEKY